MTENIITTEWKLEKIYDEEFKNLSKIEMMVGRKSFSFNKKRNQIWGFDGDSISFTKSLERYKMACDSLRNIVKKRTIKFFENSEEELEKIDVRWNIRRNRFDLLEEKLINLELKFVSKMESQYCN